MAQEKTVAFNRSVSLVESRDFDRIASVIAERSRQTVFFCNVHMLMLSQEDSALAEAMDAADWVFADGVPVAWLQRRICGAEAQVVRGYEMLLAVCVYAVANHQKVGFLGSTETVLRQLRENLTAQFSDLDVAYCSSPPFVEGELTSSPEELKIIRKSGVDWLFVGLGCPKQEKWINACKGELDSHVLGVGAAFDWLAGTSRKPPGWMEKAGLAWFFRLLQNPKNMWRRYLIYNTKFLVKALKLK